jgi:hypothetical protein
MRPVPGPGGLRGLHPGGGGGYTAVMDFNPADAVEQPTGPRLLDPGTYELKVQDAEERVSSKGNPMIALVLEAVAHPGVQIREYLVATQAAMFRIRNFCEAAGLLEKFNAGRLTEDDCRGVTVRARVMVEEGGEYPDKNRVEEYLKPGGIPTGDDMGGAPAHAAPSSGGGHQGIDEDDIPF